MLKISLLSIKYEFHIGITFSIKITDEYKVCTLRGILSNTACQKFTDL